MYDDIDVYCDDVQIDEMMVEKEAMQREARDKAEKRLTKMILGLVEAVEAEGLEIDPEYLQDIQSSVDDLMQLFE